MLDHAALLKTYSHIFDVLELTPKGNAKGDVSIGGVDSEYEEVDKARRNWVLSYQVASFSRSGYGEEIHITKHRKRLTLKQVVRMHLRAAYGGKIPSGKLQVFLVAHFSGAEGSVLADRKEVVKSMRSVRKSLVSKRATKMRIGSAKVAVHLFDTKLIAPASTQSLEKLADLLESPDSQKITIPDHYKSKMSQLLRDDHELFVRYGLQDARITLEAFLYLQECLNQVAFGEFRRLFKTLGSSSVAGFMDSNVVVKDYLKELRGKTFREAVGKMRQCFFGGLCFNYFVGATSKYEPTQHHVIVDVDIISAYPICMYLIAMVDVDSASVILNTRYQITTEVAQILRDDGIDEATITELKGTLEENAAQFKSEVHRVVKGQKRIERVLEATVVVDNDLIDKWYRDAQEHKDSFGVDRDSYVTLGCAMVRFEFPENMMNPCLAISHSKYGLQYVRKDVTLATSVEIITAMEAGAKIEAVYSVEFPISRSSEGIPQYLMRDHLKQLVTERRRHPKKSVMNLLFKECVNSFYGKFGQGINRRKVKEISTGESREIGPSPITEPITATMTTGIARAGLSAILISIEKFNQDRSDDKKIFAISATTDGVLLALPAGPGFSVFDEFYAEKDGRVEFCAPDLVTLLSRFGCQGLIDEMEGFSVLRQLKASCHGLTGSNHFLESKGVADHAVGIKSRGQVGVLNNGDVSILAKCGHRPPRPSSASGDAIRRAEGEWLLSHVEQSQREDSLIESYTTNTLASISKIIEPGGPDDMVMVPQTKKINVDYDCKRKRIITESGEISPETVPHQTFSEMIQHRRVMERIRKRGECATSEKVLAELSTKGKTTRRFHNDAGTITRVFLRGCMQGRLDCQVSALTYSEIAGKVSKVWQLHGYNQTTRKKTWTRDDVKNATRGTFETGVVMPTSKNVKLLNDLCEQFNLNAEGVREVLFSRDVFDDVMDRVVAEVVLAILHGPKMGLEPFTGLLSEGLMPDRSDLVSVLFPRVTDLAVMAHARGSFIPGRLPETDQPQVSKIFTWFGIPKEQARAAARLIAPNVLRESSSNSTFNDRLLDHFVTAALDQSLMAPAPVPPPEVLLTQLRFFGLTSKRLNRLRHVRFVPNALANTPANRTGIKKLAKAIDLSAQPFLAALLGGNV